MQLHFKELGDAANPPLVMLHGLFGSLDNWLGVAPRLAAQFRLFLVDLRNHGHSPHSDAMDYALMAGDLGEFFDARGLSRAHVLGHSLGGKVAMQFALAHGRRVDRLVVVDMAPREYDPEHAPIFKALLALDLGQFHSRREVEDALAPAIPDLTLRRFLLKNLAHEPHDARAYKWRIPLQSTFASLPQLCRPLSLSEGLRPFPNPALFLRGGQSPYVRDDDAPLIRQLFPEARIETIHQARHWVHADAPDEFVRHVLDFLAG